MKIEHTSVELKSCPHCGGKAELMDVGKLNSQFRVVCDTDGCIHFAVRVTYFVKASAIAAWNKRVTE